MTSPHTQDETTSGDESTQLRVSPVPDLLPSERMAIAVEEIGWMDSRDGMHPLRRPVLDTFHRVFYDEAGQRGGTWHLTRYFGTRIWKNPFDLWTYQELLHELRPDLIVECGTAFGGSALYYAHLCDVIGKGEVLTIDITAQDDLPQHPRIDYVSGSSTAPDVLSLVRERAADAGTVMVILDSDHSEEHVLAECRAYADIVTPGSYLVVEDTNVNGHPAFPDHGPGPYEALQRFLAERGADFTPDPRREKFLMSFNAGGWLRKRGT